MNQGKLVFFFFIFSVSNYQGTACADWAHYKLDMVNSQQHMNKAKSARDKLGQVSECVNGSRSPLISFNNGSNSVSDLADFVL